MPLLLALLLVPVLMIVLMPIALLQRIRRGGMRRQARSWFITVNAAAVTVSTAMLLVGALIMAQWVPRVLYYSLAGLFAGAVLGLFGLALTRWERGRGAMFYTPNRWLALAITSVVTMRILYGLWRTWSVWRAGTEPISVVAASGVAPSIAAGAIVLGYYVIYWAGLRRQLRATGNAPA